MKDLFDLSGKSAIITGAGDGLGKAFAEAMAEAGANVVCTGRRIENTSQTENMIKKFGVKTLAMQVDVSVEEQVKEMVNTTLDQFQRLDIIFNNAGIGGELVPAHELSLETWNKVIAVNLTGVFLCAREAAKAMMKQKSGKIINIASIFGLVGSSPPPSPNPVYPATKGGVINLTRELALEYAPFGINVNAMAPGFVATHLADGKASDPEYIKMLEPSIPLSGVAQPQDLKGTAIYLASKASDYMTGHTLVVDGGYTIK
jgi:NAD(P)-dependent dehydrogenase (short-subunit alcohol dehydrogenase family)